MFSPLSSFISLSFPEEREEGKVGQYPFLIFIKFYDLSIHQPFFPFLSLYLPLLSWDEREQDGEGKVGVGQYLFVLFVLFYVLSIHEPFFPSLPLSPFLFLRGRGNRMEREGGETYILKVGIRSERMVRQNGLSQRKISMYGAYWERFWIRPIHFFLCVPRTVRGTLPPP